MNVETLDDHTDEVWFVAFSHNGKYLAFSKDGSALIYDTETFQMRQQFLGHEDSVPFLAWSPDDTRLLICSNDRTVRLWDIEVAFQIIT